MSEIELLMLVQGIILLTGVIVLLIYGYIQMKD